MIRAATIFVLGTVIVGVFTQWPVYSPLSPGQAQLTLSLAHLAERLEPCQPLSMEEIAALPPNMRVVERCERARAPTRVMLSLGGEPLLEAEVQAVGLHRDGRAYFHRVWTVPAGRHELVLQVADSADGSGHVIREAFVIHLESGSNAVLRVGDGAATLANLESSQ